MNRRIWLETAAAAAFNLACGYAGGRQFRRANTMITYEAGPDREEYALGEEVRLRLRIVNGTGAPIEIPDPTRVTAVQPTFTLQGPGEAEPATFSGASQVPAPGAAPAGPLTLRIAAGAEWSGLVPLTNASLIAAPGEYRLGSRLEWQEIRAVAPETKFRIAPVLPVSIAMGLGARPLGNGEGLVAFLNRGRSASKVYWFQFHETRPDIAEMPVPTPIARMDAAAGATDILLGWKASPYFDEMLNWVVWREGRTLKGITEISSQPVSFNLPDEPAFLVRPGLKISNGPLDVFAVSKDGRTIRQVRFPATSRDAAGIKAGWTVALPAPPRDATAAPGPSGYHHIAFVAQREPGLEIYHTRYRGDGAPEPFHSVRLQSGRLVPGAPPAMFVAADGTARVSVLAGPDTGAGCAVIEAIFGPSGAPAGGPAGMRLNPLSSVPTTGAILYAERGGTIERAVVVAVEDGHLLRADHDGNLTPFSVEGAPTSPILLAPGKEATYILLLDPRRGMRFEPL